jgi:hypothetical protein
MPGIETDCLGMVGVHMGHRIGFGLEQGLSAGQVGQQRLGRQFRRAAEAGHEVCRLRGYRPEAEIREIDVKRRLRMTRQEAPAQMRRVRPRRSAGQRQSRMRQRVALATPRQQQRDAPVRLHVAAVQREARCQDHRRAVEVRGDRGQ